MLADIHDDRVLKLEYRGAPQTIGVMRRAALESQNHIDVRKLAEFFCSRIDSKDYVSEYLACHYGLLQHTRYMRDPRTVELVRAPYLVAQEILRGGRPSLDCDDLATAKTALDLAMGGTSQFVTIAFTTVMYDGRLQYSHVLTRTLDPRSGRWIVFDPVAAEGTAQMLSRVRHAKIWPVA